MYLMPAGASVRNRKLSGAPGAGWTWGYRPPAPTPQPVSPNPIQYTPPFPPATPAPAAPIVTGPYFLPRPRPTPTPLPPITPTPPSSSPAIPGSPVPVGYPTNQIFVDTSGNQWQFNVASGQWVNIGNPNYTGAAYYYPGTPVPQGYPTNQIFTDSSGNVWQFSAGTWVNTGSAASTSTPFLSPSGAPAPSVMTPPETSSYQSILDWLTQQTLVGGIPNWVIAAAVSFAALKLSSAGQRGH